MSFVWRYHGMFTYPQHCMFLVTSQWWSAWQQMWCWEILASSSEGLSLLMTVTTLPWFLETSLMTRAQPCLPLPAQYQAWPSLLIKASARKGRLFCGIVVLSTRSDNSMPGRKGIPPPPFRNILVGCVLVLQWHPAVAAATTTNCCVITKVAG